MKITWVFGHGHYLFQKANSFARVKAWLQYTICIYYPQHMYITSSQSFKIGDYSSDIFQV